MIVVTGGAGFIGSAFVAQLNSDGCEDVVIVDELGQSDRWKNLLGKRYKFYFSKEDFKEFILKDALKFSVEAIVHLGACSTTTERNVDYLYKNNFEYSKMLAEYSLDRGIRFINASSAATYGDGSTGYDDEEKNLQSLRPLNPYGFSKHLFDMWASQNGHYSNIVSLKYFNVFGPNEYHKGEQSSVAFKAFNQILDKGVIRLFKSYRPDFKDGEQKRDFVYVRDCTENLLWFLKNRHVNGLFNFGSGVARSWNDLADSVFSACGKMPKIDYIEMPLELQNQYQYFTEAPMEKLRRAGYSKKFYSLEDAITDYVQNFLRNSNKYL